MSIMFLCLLVPVSPVPAGLLLETLSPVVTSVLVLLTDSAGRLDFVGFFDSISSRYTKASDAIRDELDGVLMLEYEVVHNGECGRDASVDI